MCEANIYIECCQFLNLLEVFITLFLTPRNPQSDIYTAASQVPAEVKMGTAPNCFFSPSKFLASLLLLFMFMGELQRFPLCWQRLSCRAFKRETREVRLKREANSKQKSGQICRLTLTLGLCIGIIQHTLENTATFVVAERSLFSLVLALITSVSLFFCSSK